MKFKVEIYLYGLPYFTPASGGAALPERLEPTHALPELQLVSEPVEVHLRHGQVQPHFPQKLFPPYLLIGLCEAGDPNEALEKCREPLRNVVDWLRIQTLSPVTPAYSAHATPAAAPAGPTAIHADARGYIFPEFSFQALSNVQPGLLPSQMQRTLDARIGRAVAWFAKALGEPSVVDALLAIFVSLEILSTVLTSTTPSQPLRCPRCRQSIPTCPHCGRDTSARSPSIGARVQELLVKAGASRRQATRLWNLRQMVHGTKGLGRSEVSQLAQPLQDLRRFGLAAIKDATGIPPDSPPHIFSGGPTISDFTLTGTSPGPDAQP